MFSRRTNWPLSLNPITQAVDQLKRGGISFIDLTESNPTRCGFDYPDSKILQALSLKTNLIYAPHSQGMLTAREVIARYYVNQGCNVYPEQIFLTSSTSEAYSYLFRLLADCDDEILFPRPSYPLFQFLGDLNDVRLVYYPLVYSKNWQIDLKALEDMAHGGSKALVLVNPNNPTGSFVSCDELIVLNSICQRKGMAIISDEVFWDFVLTKESDQVSLSGNKEVLTFVLGGLSKTLGLPQMKLSWIVVSGPEGVVQDACGRLEMIADTYLSVNTLVQNALPEWLPLRGEIQKEIQSRLLDNLTFLEKEVHVSGCEVLTPQGGWYVVLKIPNILSEEEWVLKILQEKHVFIHPGYFFDFEKEGFLVVSLLPELKIFQEGIRRLTGCLEAG